jgi:dephospho-CoA kinase
LCYFCVLKKLRNMNIIGITGTLGAGKGTIVDYLVEHYGYKHYSVRKYLIEEAQRRNMDVNRDTFVVVANDLRNSHSPSFIIDELYRQAEQTGKNAVIESIRTPGEVQSLRKNGHFTLFAIDADPKIRYQRIVDRNSETDHISYETFLQNEQREMSSSDPNHQNLGKCMEMADYVFQNNGDFNDLYTQLESVLFKLSCS